MRKITLDADALQVTSFEPEAAPADRRGTVQAHESLRCDSARCPTILYCTNVGSESCNAGSCPGESCLNGPCY